MSELISEAIKDSFRSDAADIKALEDTRNESSYSREDLLKDTTMKIILLLITASAACLIPACSSNQGSGAVPAPEVAALNKIPLARPHPTGKKNMVISPYRPYNIIDVKGYRKGDIAGDPSTAKTDPKTGKIIESTAKYFRIP